MGSLPRVLVATTDGPLSDITRSTLVLCVLDKHTTGDHHAVIETTDGAALWARWLGTTLYLVSLPNCESQGPPPHSAPCCHFAGHGGGHTWELEPRDDSQGFRFGQRCRRPPRQGSAGAITNH
ncbi:hypothetical protein [Streptomyces sp. NPDC020965]|uniref:hypothetical protein n=1 Tax=Streptomyces sp. NPDC020965 TaxID=3365105 RepID=UPI003787BD11